MALEAASALSASSSVSTPVLSTTEDMIQFVDRYDNFLFDCDGVLWRAGAELPNAAAALSMLRRRGKRVFFVTNNSSKSRDECVLVVFSFR